MKTVIGMFRAFDDADAAYIEIKQLGYTDAEISVVAQKGMVNDRPVVADGIADGAAEGAASGAVVGGIAGLLVGLGAITVPGVGPLLAAGPLLAMLSSTAVGAGIGAATGGLLGALIDLGVSEEEAQAYSAGVEAGNILLIVSAREGDVQVIKDIMQEESAIDIHAARTTSQVRQPAHHRSR